jgi:predicted transcriptional regulator
MLPVVSPAQYIAISPENLEVANMYLEQQSIVKVAEIMDIPSDMVSEILDKREVRAYIDNIFADVGYNNRFKIRSVMDAIIAKKLEDLDEADVGSDKDIADLLQMSHKMSMDYLDRQIQLEKLRNSGGPKSQVNVQLNEFGGNKYNSLIEKLLENKI